MAAVQAQVLSHYRSEVVERIRANGHVLSAGDLTVKLAKEFGFCYGVERAIDLAYAARKFFPPDKPIYLLGEIIHNPEVNDQIRNMGIKIISPKPTEEELAQLQAGDVAIIPAFGTEVATRKRLEEKGCVLVDTTCGDVMSVWKRVRQYSKERVTSIIHGKSWHEETKATSSQARAYGSGHYLVVFTLEETDYVCHYIINGGNKQDFLEKFKGAYSEGFDPDQHFRFFDTICGATQDRQDALQKLLREPIDLLLVIGGYNSSNTSHLAEMGEAKLPTYFIKNAAKMESDRLIRHYEQHDKKEIETRDWLPLGKITVGVTAGASCPNNLIEDTIRRLFELRGISVQELLAN